MTSKSKKALYLLTPALLVLIALAIFFVFQIPQGELGQPNVLFITMDSLRHDHLGCTGYHRAHTPNIDALARDGALFMEAIAQGTWTLISVPSIVSGKYPYNTGIRMFGAHLDSAHTTIAEVLAQDRYFTLAVSRMWSKTFYQGFGQTGSSTLNTPRRTESAIQALQEHKEDKFFIWLYYWDPHAPYNPPEEYMKLYEPDYERTPSKKTRNDLRDNTGHYDGSIGTLLNLSGGKIRLTSLDQKHLFNLYDAEIAYVDAGIGEVVAELKKMDLYDNTLIVLNADHGEGFGEHQKFYHGSTVYDEMARVPLIIKPPRSKNEKKVIWGQVRNIDIMPTILDYCGLEVPEGCNGQSLRPFIEGDVSPDLPSITETHVGSSAKMHLVAFRHQGRKVIYDLHNGQVWLFDLRADPGEKNSLLSPSATIVPSPEEASDAARQKEQQMRRGMLDLLNIKQLADLFIIEKDIKEIDEKTKEQLKALGYVY